MPMIRLKKETMDLIRTQTLPGFRFACTAKERDDGDWDLPVDDEVAYRIATERPPGENDDHVVSQLVRAPIGQKLD